MFSLEVIPAGSVVVLWEGAQAPGWLLVGGFPCSGAACFSAPTWKQGRSAASSSVPAIPQGAGSHGAAARQN